MNFLLVIIIIGMIITIHLVIKKINKYDELVMSYTQSIPKIEEVSLEQDMLNFFNSEPDIYSDLYIQQPNLYLSPYNYQSEYSLLNEI